MAGLFGKGNAGEEERGKGLPPPPLPPVDSNGRAWHPSGGAHQDPDNTWPGAAPGRTGYDESVDRYRQRGAAAQAQGPLTLNLDRPNESRGLQMGSLGLLRAQAEGTAPSSAAILAQRANQNAGRQISAAGLGKGGPGAAIAGVGEAMPVAGDRALATNVQNAQQRAGEVSRGQAGLSAGANAAQGQDITTATTNAQLDAQQRALNEHRQQAYERLAWDTRNTQLQNATESAQQDAVNALNRRKARAAQSEVSKEAAFTGLGIGSSIVSGALLSDPRTKQNVVPMGSLGHLMRGRNGLR